MVISGIPGSVPQNQLQAKVLEILGLIGFKLIPDDISACHRLGRPVDGYPAKVIVRFVNRKIANFCLDHRDDLQSQAWEQLRYNLRFFPSLCSKNEESLKICKWLLQEKKITNFYVRNGFVKVVFAEGGNPTKIAHPHVLRRQFSDIPEGI